jgi:hypothetical protein
MGFWGAVEETVVDGAAGAVGLLPSGVGEVGGAAIHGVDALGHLAAGGVSSATGWGGEEFANEQYGTAAREGLSAGAAAIPLVGHGAAYLDLGQAVVNTGVAAANATTAGLNLITGDRNEHGGLDGDYRTTGERINQMGAAGSPAANLSGHSSSDTNPLWDSLGGW